MALKDYSNQSSIKATVSSGVKSPESDSELMIVEPIQRHPEIQELVRAYDSSKKWFGWVKYVEPAVEVPIEDATATKRSLLAKKISDARRLKELVDLGVVTVAEAGLPALRTEIKDIITELGGL